MNIRKFRINMLPYDILMIIIKFSCYRSNLNLICTNKYFYNLYDEMNKNKKDNMLKCASILITNRFQIYGGFCRDLFNDVCPKKIDLFCFIKDNNFNSKTHNEYFSNDNNKFPFSNNMNKYIKNIINKKTQNDEKEIYKTTYIYFLNIFKNKISIHDIIILKKNKSLYSIVVIIYFNETFIELHLNFSDTNDLIFDFWCNTLILSSFNNKYNDITKKDILNVFGENKYDVITEKDILNVFKENKYTNKIYLSELVKDEKFPLKNIINSIKAKIAIPINKNTYLKYNNCMCDKCLHENVNQKNNFVENNIIKLIKKQYLYQNNNKNICNKCIYNICLHDNINQKYNFVENNIIKLIEKQHIHQNNNKNIYNKYNCNCIYLKKKIENSHKNICGNLIYHKCKNYLSDNIYSKYNIYDNIDDDDNIFIFQKNFLKTELSGFKIFIDYKYVNYKQIEWSSRRELCFGQSPKQTKNNMVPK